MTDGPIRVVAIAGGSGSCKTTFARKLVAALGPDSAVILSQDSYYRDQSARFDGDGGAVNFDHPDALDFALLGMHLRALRSGQAIEVPIYDFATHTRSRKTEPVQPKAVIIVDGTLVLTQEPLLGLFDHAIFMDMPESVRFERRLKRDVTERGREPDGVKRQFERQVAPMHDQFVQPSCTNASLVIRHGEDHELRIRELLAAICP